MPTVSLDYPMTGATVEPAFNATGTYAEGYKDGKPVVEDKPATGTTITLTAAGGGNTYNFGPTTPTGGTWTIPVSGLAPATDYTFTATITVAGGDTGSSTAEDVTVVAAAGRKLSIDGFPRLAKDGPAPADPKKQTTVSGKYDPATGLTVLCLARAVVRAPHPGKKQDHHIIRLGGVARVKTTGPGAGPNSWTATFDVPARHVVQALLLQGDEVKASTTTAPYA
ncbi:MAG: hypothetical protein K2P78_14440 [Gemmataceae bacterium]|nr:hypothetical protein [Gemmataceae bacterium]